MMSLRVIVARDEGLDLFLVVTEFNYFKFVWHALIDISVLRLRRYGV